MRRIPKLFSAEYNNKEFILKNFNKFTSLARGISATEKGLGDLEVGAPNDVVAMSGISINKIFYVSGKLYAHIGDNRVLMQNGRYWKEIGYSTNEPCIIDMEIDGRKQVLLLGDNASIVSENGTFTPIDLYVGSCAIKYKKMLFIGNGNQLYFSKPFEYLNFETGLTEGGLLTTDKLDGDIIALIPTKSALIIVCERGIYHLYADGKREDYKLIRQDVSSSIARGSVKGVGDTVYLFSDNTLCKYKGGALTKLDCALEDKYVCSGHSGVNGNYYSVGLTDKSGNEYMFVYNVISGKESLIKSNQLLITDGGYFFEEGKIKVFASEATSSSDISWQSVELDFNTALIKSLVGIEIKSKKAGRLELEYSYGKQAFDFESGLTSITPHVVDKSFTIKLIFNEVGLEVEFIKFIYRLQREGL